MQAYHPSLLRAAYLRARPACLGAFAGIALVLAMPAGLYGASPATETWDNGLLNGWLQNTTQTTVEARNVGGNPGGYLFSYGTVGASFDIGAQTHVEVFTGNYQDPPIQYVSVDVSFVEGSFDAAWVRFRYHSSEYNGWLHPLTSTFPQDGWHSYSVDFDPTWSDIEARAAGWLTDEDVYPADPSQPFAVTMADVYNAEVRLSGEGYLEAGIDNFQIAIPEPAALSLLALGGLALIRRRRG